MSEDEQPQPQPRRVPPGAGERWAPRSYWFVGPEGDPAGAADEAASAADEPIDDPRDLADRAVLDELAALDAKQSRMAAQRALLVARLGRSAIERGGRNQQSQSIELRSMAREVACRLRSSQTKARRELDDALSTTASFPTLVHAQAHGAVTAGQSSVIAHEAAALCDGDVSQAQRDAYVDRALAAAADRAPAKLTGVVRRLVEQVVSQPVTLRHERAIADRHVSVTDVDDGMAHLDAYLPAVQAHAIKDRLDQGAARRCADDPRTRDQWRADALSAVLLTGDAANDVHEHCADADCVPRMLAGITATVAITVPMLSLANDDPSYPVQPAMLDGVAPMSMTTAAAFVGDRGAMQRWLTHPVTGQVIAVDTRFASRQLAREVHGRDGSRCRQPSCASTRRLQQDHNRRWVDGGATSSSNLADLCPSCHIVKDSTAWRLRMTPAGDAMWTSPLGYRSVDRGIPPDIPLDPAHLPCALPDTG